MECDCYFTARWVSAEAADGNLSILDTGTVSEITGTSQMRWIPKLSSVTGLTSTSTVLCTANPVVIIGIIVGDITLAAV